MNLQWMQEIRSILAMYRIFQSFYGHVENQKYTNNLRETQLSKFRVSARGRSQTVSSQRLFITVLKKGENREPYLNYKFNWTRKHSKFLRTRACVCTYAWAFTLSACRYKEQCKNCMPSVQWWAKNFRIGFFCLFCWSVVFRCHFPPTRSRFVCVT